MARLFGTDGVRGIANQELSGPLAFKLGKYGARVLRNLHQAGNKVIIGHDGRISADMLVASLASGFASEGLDVYLADLLPTPAIASLTKNKDYALGVMVSASHNPFEFNGIKFFDHSGYKLPDHIEDEIEALVLSEEHNTENEIHGDQLGRIYHLEDANEDYLEMLLSKVKPMADSFRVALDCANGATMHTAEELFKSIGCDVVARLGSSGDGTNINEQCGSTHPEHLAQTVVANQCDLGFAFDGDGDRLIALDRNGKIVDGDQLMALVALAMKKRGRLAKNTLVATVMSNLGLHKFCMREEISLELTKVGDRYVMEKMLEKGYNLGGEQSGHIILHDFQTTGDGQLSALAVIDALLSLEMDLSELSKIMQVYPQMLLNVKLPNEMKEIILTDEKMQKKLQEKESILEGNGRILLRASGTEPLIRIMVEAQEIETAEATCLEMKQFIEENYLHTI